MELLYLWIEKYKNIEKQGFNFSSQYRFDYKPDSGELTIEENPNHIPDFFPEGISNVTAIIGENGSGKSTLFEFLCELPRAYVYIKDDAGYVGKFIIVFSNIIYHHNELKIRLVTKLNFTLKPFQKKEDIDEYNISTPIIHYSSVVDSKPPLIEPLNISTKKILDTAQFQFKEIYRNSINLNIIDSFIRINLRMQIKFLSDFRLIDDKFKLPLNIPSHLGILFNMENKNHLFSDEFRNKYDKINILKTTNATSTSAHTNDFLNNLFWHFTFALIIAAANELQGDDLKNEIDTINGIFLQEPTLYSINEYLNHLAIQQGNGVKIETDISVAKESLNFFSKIKDYINEGKVSIQNDLLYIPLNYEVEFIDNFLYLGFNTPIFDYYWSNGNTHIFLSSGEDAFLVFFSRFYSIIQNSNYYKYNYYYYGNPKTIDIRESEKLLILIDEGELSLHPQWQKQYFKILIDFFEIIFLNEVNLNEFKSVPKNIQIILTSHSPFIASDLPKDNVIFLRKGEEEDGELKDKCIVVKEGDRKFPNLPQTFGQNIHTLFAESFFMEGGLIGDFAETKIKELVKEINTMNNETDKALIRKKIEIIGEPILKQKIEAYFKNNYKESLDEQIAEAEKNLEKLRAKKQKEQGGSE